MCINCILIILWCMTNPQKYVIPYIGIQNAVFEACVYWQTLCSHCLEEMNLYIMNHPRQNQYGKITSSKYICMAAEQTQVVISCAHFDGVNSTFIIWKIPSNETNYIPVISCVSWNRWFLYTFGVSELSTVFMLFMFLIISIVNDHVCIVQ